MPRTKTKSTPDPPKKPSFSLSKGVIISRDIWDSLPDESRNLAIQLGMKPEEEPRPVLLRKNNKNLDADFELICDHLKESLKKPTSTPPTRKLRPYILALTQTCSLCQTTFTILYDMQPSLLSPHTHSLVARSCFCDGSTKPDKIELKKVKSCHCCFKNLQRIPKIELIKKLISIASCSGKVHPLSSPVKKEE